MPNAGSSVMKASAGSAAAAGSSMRTVTVAPTGCANLARHASGKSATATCSMTTVFMLGSISCGASYAFDHLSAGACCAVALVERAVGGQ
jgi:hypothetical protein